MSNTNATPAPQTLVETAAGSPKFTRSADFRSTYINFIQAGFSMLDISLMMGEVAGISPDQHPIIEFKTRVTMAPVEVKILQAILVDTVQKYEAQFGTIVVPAGVFPQGASGESSKTEGV